ncbi:14780_t:CDS:2, partial [Funneliformis geosporum]
DEDIEEIQDDSINEYDKLSESFINVLKLLEVKQKYNLTDYASNDILNIFANDRFKLQFNDPKRALDLEYRSQYINNEEYSNDNISDIFDENLYKELANNGYFSDERDIALI